MAIHLLMRTREATEEGCDDGRPENPAAHRDPRSAAAVAVVPIFFGSANRAYPFDDRRVLPEHSLASCQ
jgi:hypothetical protein